MPPVLIFTDNAAIATQTAVLNNAVPYFQGIYNALQAIGITPSLQDLSQLSSWTKNNNGNPGFQLTYVTNKLVALAAPSAIFNGIAVSPDKLAGLITIPDLTGFSAALAANGQVWVQGNTGIDITLLQIVDNVISALDTAIATITTKYTYYTVTDASATLANTLQAACTALNTYEAAYNNPILTGYQNSPLLKAFNDIVGYTIQKESPFKGIAVVGTTFVVSLLAIRNYEAQGFVY